MAEAADVADCDTPDLLLAEEQARSAVPTDEPALSAAGGERYFFVIGENRSGVRSAEQMLAEYAPLNKVDSARRCGLYHGRLEKNSPPSTPNSTGTSTRSII